MSNENAMVWSYRRDECDDRIHLIRDEKDIVASYLRLGLAYTKEDGYCSVVKHGDYDDVKSYVDRFNKLMGDLSDIHLIDISNANMDDVNFVLERSAIQEKHFLKLTNIIDIEADVIEPNDIEPIA